MDQDKVLDLFRKSGALLEGRHDDEVTNDRRMLALLRSFVAN